MQSSVKYQCITVGVRKNGTDVRSNWSMSYFELFMGLPFLLLSFKPLVLTQGWAFLSTANVSCGLWASCLSAAFSSCPCRCWNLSSASSEEVPWASTWLIQWLWEPLNHQPLFKIGQQKRLGPCEYWEASTSCLWTSLSAALERLYFMMFIIIVIRLIKI